MEKATITNRLKRSIRELFHSKTLWIKNIVAFLISTIFISCSTSDSRSCVRAMMEDYGYSRNEAKEMCDDMRYESQIR